MSFDQTNKPIFRAAVVFLPQSSCPIAAGQVGTWLDSSDGLLKTRNADGTDSIGGGGGEGTLPTVAVNAATTAALAGSPVYDNGTAGVGATLTKATNGALPAQDGVTLTAGQLLLVKDQSAPEQNGLYVVTTVGAGGVKWVLTRSPMFNTAAKIKEGSLFVPQAGSVNGNLLFELTSASSPVVGTDAISFTQAAATVSGAAVKTALATVGAANGVVGTALSATAQRLLAFAGHNNVGACTLTGAKVGDTVTGVIDLAGASVSAAASFESTITVADQIQQTSSSNLSAVKYAALLVAKS